MRQWQDKSDGLSEELMEESSGYGNGKKNQTVYLKN
jgi:hypothetical protein